MRDIEISALIASHGRNTVGKAIQSVLNQTLESSLFELIVVADKRLDVLRKFELDSRLTIKYSDHSDPGGKWAEAIRIAKGDIICFLDDDDEWVPEKLVQILKTFRENVSVGYYHNGHTSIDYDGTVLTGFPELRHYYAVEKVGRFSTVDHPQAKFDYQYLASLGAPFNSSCISLRRELLLPYVDLLSEGMWMVDYFWFYAFSVSDYDILIDNMPLTLYRRRTDAAGDLLNNIRNNQNQKITIFERYIFSHRTYMRMAVNTPLDGYLSWMVHKTELMLWFYKGKIKDRSMVASIVDMIRFIPRRSYTGFFSSVLVASAAFMAFFSRKISLNFVRAMERLGLSLI